MTILIRLLWVGLGYGAAVLTATLVTVALIVAASALPDQGKFGSYFAVKFKILDLAFVGLILTGTYAFPGWLITVVVAEKLSISQKTYFTIAGAFSAVLAHIFFIIGRDSSSLFGLTGETGAIYLWSILGGLCGGLVYWAIAIECLSKWKPKP